MDSATPSSLSTGFYDREMQFVMEPVTIAMMIGSSSDDVQLTDEFESVGQTTGAHATSPFFSAVEVS
jgi:beta-glucosidase